MAESRKDKIAAILRREHDDGFCSGVLAAVYHLDFRGEDVMVEEIVAACGAEELMKYAIRERDSSRPALRKAIRSIERRRRGRG